MKVAYIKWLDASRCGNKSLSAVAKMKGMVMETAGLLVNEDDEAIRVALDIYSYSEGDEVITTARDGEIIPQKYIISKRIIEIEEEP